MQRRIVPRKELELFIQSLKPHPEPKPTLEQYTVSPEVAAEMLFIAEYRHRDISEKTVVDLGCGSGRLALGCVYLGARLAVGVDIDKRAIGTAKENAATACQKGRVQWILSDATTIVGRFDTVVQNPPFGVLRKGADRIFVAKALEIADVVYSLHKSGVENRVFIKRLAERHGGTITDVYQLKFEIPHIFAFHHKKKHLVEVDLFRMIKNG